MLVSQRQPAIRYLKGKIHAMNLATRTAAHRDREQAKRTRKRLRAKRAAIHAAMTEAARMKRSRKKGTTDLIANMRTLGYEPRRASRTDLGGGGDVLDKFRPVA